MVVISSALYGVRVNVLRSLGHQDDRMQADSIAHRDHLFPAYKIEASGRGLQMRRCFAGVVGILRLPGVGLSRRLRRNHKSGTRNHSNREMF
jgi:hypothetical protein